MFRSNGLDGPREQFHFSIGPKDVTWEQEYAFEAHVLEYWDAGVLVLY